MVDFTLGIQIPDCSAKFWHLLLVPLNILFIGIATGCDRTFVSTSEGSKNGTFSSPSLVNLPVDNVSHVIQCLYTFIAAPGERVQLSFDGFAVRGAPPECMHEYIDVYSEVPDGKDLSDLINTPFGGRYCGHIPPRTRVSLYRTLVLGFTTDQNFTNDRLFYGNFAFVKDDKYLVGTVSRSPCNYVINVTTNRTGDIITPTYPGVYPKDLHCTYKLVGKKGQRILIEFRDFDIFYGGSHCPFDYVNVYDGPDSDAPLIGTYCGQQRNLVIYSTEHFLFLTFTSLPRTADAQNRGFSGIYEFSESFVKLDFISRNDGHHIRGTECDQRILSKKGSSGVIYSPNYPFPYVPKTVCRYFVYGLQDMQHYERVKLEFEKFDVPSASQDGNCSEEGGFVRVFLRGQEAIQVYEKGDYEFCGKEQPPTTSSDSPRLAIIFASGPTQGSGFKAKYSFSTEYQIPGTPAPDGSCRFTYLSSSTKQGEFNSPRHPSNYPSNTTCVYTMVAEYGEQVRLVFDNFKLRTTLSTHGTYGEYCKEDWVEIHNIFRNGTSRLFGRYCNETAPGPIESTLGASGLKVVFKTDSRGVSSGFKARYVFDKERQLFEVFPDCGENIISMKPGANSGTITSLKYPGNYDGGKKVVGARTCHWHITARPGHKVLLFFANFGIEGKPEERGCPVAAVRVWPRIGDSPIELCGESLEAHQMQHLSEGNHMRITFSIADKAVGAPGFKAIWTEVESIESGGYCTQFECGVNRFCLHRENRCDGVSNCGFNDTTDETYGCSANRPVIALFLLTPFLMFITKMFL